MTDRLFGIIQLERTTKNTQIDYSLKRMGLNDSENYELFDFGTISIWGISKANYLKH